MWAKVRSQGRPDGGTGRGRGTKEGQQRGDDGRANVLEGETGLWCPALFRGQIAQN